MVGWVEHGPGRWVHDGDDRHLLLQAAGRYVEVHGTTVHAYDGPGTADLQNPLGAAIWAETSERPDLDGATTDVLWQVAADDYTDG